MTRFQCARPSGFPDRSRIERAIVAILKEHGGKVRIRSIGGRSIYDLIADRLGVSKEARARTTRGTGEAAWRPEVGFARKNLVERGVLEPTSVSGTGVWQLSIDN